MIVSLFASEYETHSMNFLRTIRRFPLLTIIFCAFPVIAQDTADTVEIVSESAVITFSLNGAYPIGWDIVDPEFVQEGESVPLIYKDGGPDFPYPFRLILDGPDGELTGFANTTKYSYELVDTEGSGVRHVFTSPIHSSGLLITKKFELTSRFHSTLEIDLTNTMSTSTLGIEEPAITLGAGLGSIPKSIGGLGDSMYSYVEAVGYGNGNLTPFELSKEETEIQYPEDESTFDWIGVHNRYYLMAVATNAIEFTSARISVPDEVLGQLEFPDEAIQYFPEIELGMNLAGIVEATISLLASLEIYAGPKDRASLRKSFNEVDYDLDSVMYSSLPNWMRWITFKLGALLNAINGIVHVWWVTLLVLVVIVRLLLFPVAQKAIKMNEQMLADQAKLKPHIDALKEKHNDPNVQYQKTMALYKEHRINPMAPMLGCLPVLLQLPILIAIFNLLGQEVKMQGATFLWVKDLSIPDQLFELPFVLPYFGGYFNLLPLLMSVTMVLTTNMGTTAEGDQKKTQMRSMTILAFVFFALFYSFPAGLVLYWMMSNIGQYIQQEVMARRMR